ncbi:cyclopropane-fatty-acyl-phospholipid synthase [Antricoccus suffuscus]|uniref:Cyclopropane-fatty-acyl-phospholipid synthase n=1 Tax=Antricoccus suffuscus TaxID=1629062 RepID=A0A2T1A671_9ACTN|nr:cyclopropane-fatty-acyl-phospholipid synthase family protein [Antricoccus suffuscus]PRZ44086.1 cyclopropane-fatty-acyl-phospholipid synthase [Antricoccus suffuscus]
MTSTAERVVALVRPVIGSDLPVRIRAWDGSEAGPLNAPVVHLTSRRALRRILWHPDELGLAQAYVTGELDAPGGADDVVDALRRAWQTTPTRAHRPDARHLLTAVATGARLGALGLRPKPPVSQARLDGDVHTTTRDKAAISHHYDLSNDFYALLLDESMAYSCAYYSRPDMSLAEAQRAKLDLICRKLDLRPGMRLLDVGCGWGSLSLHAAEHYGAVVLGVTISRQQQEFVAKRIADRGLDGQVEVRLQDYREVREAPFDAVSSIEMGEHVGEDNYGTYAGVLFEQLKPSGRMLLQQMSRHRDAAPGGGAFIENFIAPDMHMRPLPDTLRFLQDAGFEIREVQAMREHYARTVADWHDTFEKHYREAVSMVGEEIARVWRLYLIGGGLTFEQGRMGVDQILAVRPAYGAASVCQVPDWNQT